MVTHSRLTEANRVFPFRSATGDYQFDARRRGPDVIIKGEVIGPPGAVPYLVPEFNQRRQTRAFRLAFHHNSTAIPFVTLTFEHVLAAVSRDVDLLQIHLPNEESVKIGHRE